MHHVSPRISMAPNSMIESVAIQGQFVQPAHDASIDLADDEISIGLSHQTLHTVHTVGRLDYISKVKGYELIRRTATGKQRFLYYCLKVLL